MPLSNPNAALRNAANTYTTGGQDYRLVGSLLVPSSASYAPTAAASVGYDSTTDRWVAGGAGTISGKIPRTLSVTAPNETLTNSTTSAQDYTSIFTVPANYLITNRLLRVTLNMESVTLVSSATRTVQLKLGSTIILLSLSANLTDNTTANSGILCYWIRGTAAAGASVSVEAGVWNVLPNATFGGNTIAQPVAAIATNGTLNINPGVTWSGTGSTETLRLMSACVEEVY